MAGSRGFSLIELLMVVSVIGLLAALAVPNLVQSKKAANEASAIAAIRELTTAQMTYSATVGSGSFGSMASLQDAGFIDSGLGSGTKDGYNYTVTATGSTAFTLTAVPISSGLTGERGFYCDETAVIRYTTDGSAPNASSSALGTSGATIVTAIRSPIPARLNELVWLASSEPVHAL